MKELIKINNKWVKPSDWEQAVSHHPFKAIVEQAINDFERLNTKVKVVEENGCKTYDEIVDVFKNDEPRPEVYKLSRKWQDKVTLGQDLKELRALLGWPLYQEWLRETITG